MMKSACHMTSILIALFCTTPVLAQGSEGEAPSVEEILTRLEKKGEEIKDIRCNVEFVQEDGINLSTSAKRGEITLMMQKPAPVFLITFSETFIDGLKGKREWYLFDGEFLFDALERTQQVTRRRVANAGEDIDLFDIEKAPFPMPFGQKKDKLLKNFEITMVPSQPGDPKNTWHLQGYTRPESDLHRYYEQLDLYISKELNLPVRIIVRRNGGMEIQTAEFPDLSSKSFNRGLKPDDFKRPKEWKGYKEVDDK